MKSFPLGLRYMAESTFYFSIIIVGTVVIIVATFAVARSRQGSATEEVDVDGEDAGDAIEDLGDDQRSTD